MESSSYRNKQKMAKLPEQINLNKLNTSSVMYNGNKRYSLISLDNTKENIFIQSPLFIGVLDVEEFKDYTELYFKFNNYDQSNNFINFINNIEQKIMSLAYENKDNWFGKQENIRFRSIIKNLEEDNSKAIKFRIPHDIKIKRLYVDSLNSLNTSDSEMINLKEIDTENNFRLIININAIWFSEDLFGIYLRPVYVEEIIECEYKFQDEDKHNIFLDTDVPLNKQKNIKIDINKLNKLVEDIKSESQNNKLGRRLRKKDEDISENTSEEYNSKSEKLEDSYNENIYKSSNFSDLEFNKKLEKQDNDSDVEDISDLDINFEDDN